ncbi:MAG: hypothetical protein U9O49_03755 [Candidatus Thermoplasmatota archaeon]|nr:hypothetical protein [Candidatus Thermoplasmatota archaeon]
MLFLFFSTIDVSTTAEEESPDLILEIDQDVMESLNEIEESIKLEIPVKIKNIGGGNTSGQSIGIALKIDGVIVSFNKTSEVLEKDSACIMNLSWTPSFSFIGPHLLSIMVVMVDYNGIILGEDENNNVWDKYVEIVEKYTDLKLMNLYYSGTSKVDETIKVFANGTLKIRSVEKNKPDISSMTVLPSNQEQGGVVTITADVTDDSGLEYVRIKIILPSNEVYTANMTRTDGDCFKFNFEDTLEIGIYDFTIWATDISVHLNKAEKLGTFEIYEDSTDPEISYFDATPYIQTIDNYVEISCVATDNIGIETLKVIITSPSKTKLTKYMTYSSEGKYVYEDVYNITGKYSFYVRAMDLAGNYYTTDSKFFWVTEDVSDTDNDGMPDWWEEKYGLDPKNPLDAEEDKDGDGISNIREYQLGNNPSRDILMQNMAPRLKDNTLLILTSIFLFILIIFVSKYGQRGRLI